MKIYYNLENYLLNNDKLRGHLGRQPTDGLPAKYVDKTIVDFKLEAPSLEALKMFPTISQKLYIYSNETMFRDGEQWRKHVNSLISANTTYVDHTFSLNSLETKCSLVKPYHNPAYEDLTKILDTRELLNYNIVNTTSDSNLINDMGTLRNRYDGEIYQGDNATKGNNKHTKKVIDNYNKLLNLAEVSRADLLEKNKNIYIINKKTNNKIDRKEKIWPCYVNVTNHNGIVHDNSLIELFENYSYEKLIFQSMNKSNNQQNINFHNDTIRSLDITDLFYNLDYKNFKEHPDELFLLENHDSSENLSNRFVNQINTIKVLNKINTLIQDNLRDYQKIIDLDHSKCYNLGYKVEKYLNNTNSTPIQTFYIKNDENHLDFIDTQLKFGAKYIYKVYNVCCVLGNSYRYENLDISSYDDDSVDPNAGYDLSHDYRASVDIRIYPSMKILEVPLYSSEKMFFDKCPPTPWIDISLSKRGINIVFEPLGYNELAEYEFQPIHPDEQPIRTNLHMSSDGFSQNDRGLEYFHGDYIIYRLTTPPESIEDFYNAPSIRVFSESVIIQNNNTVEKLEINEKIKSLASHHDDKILANKKYYYLFRAISHHGTPSNPSKIYEVEITQTAADRLLSVSLYEFKTHMGYKKSKDFKRLLKVEPNNLHLEFPLFDEVGTVDEALDNMRTAGKDLFSEHGNRFKIRLTSKHTGKKIDLNVNFKIIKKTI